MRRTTHELAVVASCPVDEQHLDVYEVTVTVEGDRVLPVEEILEAGASVSLEPIFQEDLTSRLAELLGCRVETVGHHSDVVTRCVCFPVADAE